MSRSVIKSLSGDFFVIISIDASGGLLYTERRQRGRAMSFRHKFPLWDRLRPDQQRHLLGSLTLRTVKKGTVLRGAHTDCCGPYLIRFGQLRASILSDEGHEFTLYRLFEGDLCIFCAADLIPAIRVDVTIVAEKETTLWHIPKALYRQLMTESAAVANYTNELVTRHFAEAMNRMELYLWGSMERRVAAFLLQEAALEGSQSLHITHEAIARHLGSHREVITRMLHAFRKAGLVRLARGTVTLLDTAGLEALRT